MEAGSSSDATAKAAPRKGALWIVIAIVVAVAVTAAVMDLAVFPALQPTQTAYVRFHVTAVDVGYNKVGFNPQLDVKAGQIVLIEMNNSGTMDHEFLLFNQDRATILARAKAALAIAERHNPGYATNEAIGNATVDEYNSLHDAWANLSRFMGVDRDVAPDHTTTFWFIISTPGTYFFACHQVDRTDWKIHQDKGMWGTIVVS